MADGWIPKVTDEDFTDIGATEVSGDSGPQIRLLRCTKCRTLEELPDFVGDPRDDVLLDHLVAEHQQRHPFHDDETDAFLLRISEELWHNPRTGRKIHDRIWSDLKDRPGVLGLPPSYYDSKSTFQEDAVKCHVQHHRQVPCIDWHSDRKRIGNPTKEGWKRGEVKIFLCDFCPVAVEVARMRRGD